MEFEGAAGQFQHGVAAAVVRQLQEQEDSVRSFIGAMAELLASTECSPAEIATSLKQMEKAGHVQNLEPALLGMATQVPVPTFLSDAEKGPRNGDLKPSTQKWMAADGIPPNKIRHEQLAPRCSPTKATDDEVELEQSITGITGGDDAADAKSKIALERANSMTTQADDGDGVQVPDNVIEENRIDKLDFLTCDGTIRKGPTRMENLFGQRYLAFKARLVSMLECCCGRPAKGMLANFVNGPYFKLLSATVIILNYFFIVAQSDYKIEHINKDEPPAMQIIGYSFTIFYVIELCFSIWVAGMDFFSGSDMAWNIFDMAIVIVAVCEVIIKNAGLPTVNTSFLRILRFFKLSRVLRMFSALRTVKEIRIMVDALAGCLSLFVFCVILLAVFLSVFAIFFVQGFAGLLESNSDFSDLELKMIRDGFGSVSAAMLTLFQTCTGGMDWGDSYVIILYLDSMYRYLFLAMVVFYIIAFFNVVTGVFCEKAMSLAMPTQQELVAGRCEKEMRDAKEMLGYLNRFLQHDGSNRITVDKFDDFIHNKEVELYFEIRGMKSSSARKFFRLLCDLHQMDSVDFATFISALVKLDGVASSIDAHCLSVRQLHGLHQLQRIQRYQHEEMVELKDTMHRILDRLPPELTNAVPGVNYRLRREASI